jgi:hypothetical protein
VYALSTVVGADGKAGCPQITGAPKPPPTPSTPWSKNTLKVDCAGNFKLCYTLKAGDAAAPLATDCVVSETCTSADYAKENVEQAFPDLPAWVGADPVCAKQFQDRGGYGEMSVVGKSVLCDKIDDGTGKAAVFSRVRYCSSACNKNPGLPECANCGQGGSGSFP